MIKAQAKFAGNKKNRHERGFLLPELRSVGTDVAKEVSWAPEAGDYHLTLISPPLGPSKVTAPFELRGS